MSDRNSILGELPVANLNKTPKKSGARPHTAVELAPEGALAVRDDQRHARWSAEACSSGSARVCVNYKRIRAVEVWRVAPRRRAANSNH